MVVEQKIIAILAFSILLNYSFGFSFNQLRGLEWRLIYFHKSRNNPLLTS